MIKKTILWRLLLCPSLLMLSASLNLLSAQTGPNDDFDGDGIINSIDLDDDNDGVPDAIESPSCYYTANEWNTLAKPAVGVSVSSALTTTTGNFAQLLDGVTGVNAVAFSTAPAQTVLNRNVYLFTFTLPVKLNALYLRFNSATQFNGNTKIQGSNTNNGSDWVDLSAEIGFTAGTNTTVNGSVSVATSIKYPVTLSTTTAYKYIRITGGATASNITAANASEVYFDFNTTAYVASMFAKATCVDANIDGDNILPQFDLDTDGDGAGDALESSATASTTTNFQFPDIDTNNDGLVDAVDANNDGIVDYTSTYYPKAVNNKMSPLFAEICNDGIDNDGDGYIDGFDSDCGFTVPSCTGAAQSISNFSIARTKSTNQVNANSTSPTVGDLDGDGMPEIIVASASNDSYRIYKGDGSDFSDDTKDIIVPTMYAFPGYGTSQAAIADIDKDGKAEIIIYGGDQFIYVFNYTGGHYQTNYKLKSNLVSGLGAGAGSPRIHDINEDGIPEVIVGNAVFTFNSTFTALTRVVAGNASLPNGNTTNTWERDVVVIDVIKNVPGKELVAGSAVYSVDFTNGVLVELRNLHNLDAAVAANEQGASAVADMDLDGDLDIVFNSQSLNKVYIWDPTNNIIVDSRTIGGGYKGMPVITDVYNDVINDGKPRNLPEAVFLGGTTIYCINLQYPSNIWTLATSDGSGTTAISAFDFNGDGVKEIVYRDQSTLRVFNGNIAGTPTVLHSFVSGSGTWAECPVIADVDNDGQAEIAIVSEHVATGDQTGLGYLDIYEAGPGTRWVDAPNYWNQREYRYTNINKNLTVPVQEQQINIAFPSGSGRFPLNISNVQVNEESLLTPTGQIAAPDLSVSSATITNTMADGTVNCSNVRVQYQTNNTGSAAMNSNVYVYVYDKDPRTQTTANLIYQNTTTLNIPVGGSSTQNLQFGVPASSLPASNLYIVINSNPNMTVLIDQTDFVGSYPECDYTNNIFTLALPSCSDIDGDGIADGADIDDDNDGIVDAVESPSCFYTALEMATPNTVTSQIPTTGTISNLYDNNATSTFAFTATTAPNALGKTVFEVNPNSPTAANSIILNLNAAASPIGTLSATATLAAEGWNGTNWITLATYTAAPAITANVQIFAFTNTTAYSKYRLFEGGTVGVAISANAVQEVKLGIPATYVPSANQKPINCTVDTDNDGIPNHQDLDSDGDGCSDLKESGVSPSTDVFTPASANNSNGTSYGIDPAKLAGSQLNPSAADTNNDGLNDSVDSDLNGITNYTSTYNAYAVQITLNTCLDTDGDGIGDLIDVDDDNDGILDTLEQNCPNGSKTGVIVTKPATITYNMGGVSATHTLADLVDGVDSNIYVMYNPTGTLSNAEWFRVEFPYARVLSSWEVGHYGTQYLFSTTSTYKVQGSNDASVWTDLTGTLTYSNTQNGQSTQANNSNIANFSSNLIAYKYYRYYGISGTAGNGWATEFYFKDGACLDIDTDGDLIPNRLDLDSDGDGCPDALEAGVSVNAGAFTSMSASGGAVYTGGIPSGTANAYVGNGTPSQYGTNGFFNGIETAVDSGVYNGTYTYSLYALSLAQNVCKDTDGDNVPDVFDLDDDNDGVLDVVECPTLFANMATGGGFSTSASALPNWYMGLASATLPIAEPFTSTVIPISNNGSVYNYGIGGGSQVNSPLTGGLFDSLDGGNTAAGLQYVLQENDPFRPVVNKLSSALVAGVPYNYAFDLGQRSAASSTNKYIVMLYNADTQRPEKIIESGTIGSLPGTANNPTYKNFTGSFTPASSANYYLLFYPSISGGAADDFVIDRVAVAGAGAGACDTDNDGIPNYLDLDSDGDGCPDTKEAILYNHATEASIAATVQNGSGGVVTSTTPNVPNAMVPGPYGNNGFADALQLASNPDAYKYVYSYQFVADNVNVSTCDNKFLFDIDSDDDGIPDAVESPSCFYTEAQAMDITEGVTSDFGWTTANPLSKTYDDITVATNYGEISAPTATSIQNKALITFDLPIIDAWFINNVKLNVGATFGLGKWKLQGLDMVSNTWTDLSATAGQPLSAGIITFNNTLQPTVRYHTYRIIGVDNVNITNAARLIEFSIQYNNYNPSFHRTKMGCNSDADGDGVPNYLDRDSDGDGCPDAVEASIPLSLLGPSSFFNIGGQVSGDHVIVTGAYGANGMGDSVETTPDSGIVNYTSTYTVYANNKSLNFCTDTDGDGVPDLTDIDDDNDGVLDLTECAYPAIPNAAATSNIFAAWNNASASAQGTNSVPAYIASIGAWTAGSGLTATINASNFVNVSNVNGSTLADAFGSNEYLEHPFTTTADNYNSLYYVRTGANDATNYHSAVLISDDNFVTYTILNIDMARAASGNIVYDISDYQLKPSTSYKVRTYFWGATALTFDDFTLFGFSECDTDNDGVPNRLDLDSDGDGCTDATESGTVAYALAQTGGQTSAGTVVNTSGTATGVLNAIVGNNTPSDYGVNGFYTKIESSDLLNATYTGTYTYASVINAAISGCFCYKPAATSGTVLDTKQGITSLQRAGSDNDNWPMVRKGAWTALESKTKGFVPNRLTLVQINSIPATNLVEGMMVYNITSDCLYINTDGTATGWKCFNTQTCP